MKTNHVYDLSFTNDLNRLDNKDAASSKDPVRLAPNEKLQLIAEYAYEMGTTLWFDKEKKEQNSLPALVACGQFTTCYNLLIYIDRLKQQHGNMPSHFSGLNKEWQEKINLLEAQMANEYEEFKKDPFWLYNKMGHEYIPGFKNYNMEEFEIPVKKFEGLRN